MYNYVQCSEPITYHGPYIAVRKIHTLVKASKTYNLDYLSFYIHDRDRNKGKISNNHIINFLDTYMLTTDYETIFFC